MRRSSGDPQRPGASHYLVGGYGPNRGGHADGIGRAGVTADGRIDFMDLVAPVPSPTWLTLHGDVVHAALEETNEIASFRVEGDTLRLLSRHATAGTAPCHLAVASGALVVACYGTGELGVHPLEASGAAGPLVQSVPSEGSGPREAQKGPHAHHVMALDDQRVLSLDLGTDSLLVHRWVDRRLTRIDSVAFPPGTGPRDLRELSGGRIAALGEWGCDVHLLAPVGDSFRIVASVAMDGAGPEDQGAGLGKSADGRFLYSGLRGSNRISVVEIDGDALRSVGSVDSGGTWPRHLTVQGDVLHVAHQHSDSIVSFRLGVDGLPTQIGEPAPAPSPSQLLRIR